MGSEPGIRRPARRKGIFRRARGPLEEGADRWASAHAWAGLQILQQAVGKAGLDRKKIRDYIAEHEFDTVIGKIRFKNGENVSTRAS